LSARLNEHPELGRVEFPGLRQPALDLPGQGQVHVVAAQEQVIADRLANERQLPLLLLGPDQAEVAGPAADVHH